MTPQELINKYNSKYELLNVEPILKFEIDENNNINIIGTKLKPLCILGSEYEAIINLKYANSKQEVNIVIPDFVYKINTVAILRSVGVNLIIHNVNNAKVLEDKAFNDVRIAGETIFNKDTNADAFENCKFDTIRIKTPVFNFASSSIYGNRADTVIIDVPDIEDIGGIETHRLICTKEIMNKYMDNLIFNNPRQHLMKNNPRILCKIFYKFYDAFKDISGTTNKEWLILKYRDYLQKYECKFDIDTEIIRKEHRDIIFSA